jgi:hypothetical protein
VAKAEELRKAEPTITKEQAFARTYSDPRFAELANGDRRERREAPDLDAVMLRVRDGVRDATNGKQSPDFEATGRAAVEGGAVMKFNMMWGCARPARLA